MNTSGQRTRVGQRAPQHDFAELAHETVLLGKRNERRRRDRAARRVSPAQQRLDADDGTAVGGDDRLIVHIECLRRNRGFKFAQQKAPVGLLGLDLRLEAPHRAAPVALGGAQRQTGAARQLLAGGAVFRRLRHADAGGDLPTLPGRCLGATNGSENDARSAAASMPAVSASSPLAITANSSSSKRPSTAPVGRAARRRSAMARSTASPPVRPIVSLTSRKPSRSSSTKATFPAPRRDMTRSSVCSMTRWLGRPVSASSLIELARGLDAASERTREPPRRPRATTAQSHERDADRAGQRP